ncbi:discoidin domain-containing protein [Acidiphilium sp. MT5]
MSERDVLVRFQSIGNNCEFGSVQKSLGIGRLSLLQWVESSPQKLVRAIHDNLTVFVDRDDIGVLEDRSEYFWFDPVYGLKSHSFIRVSDMSREDFVKTIRSRNRFLVRKFLEELEEGGHIFVYNFFGEPLPTLDVLSELAAMLSRRAPNYLLAVGLPSDACSEDNKVFHWQSGLMLATKDAHTSFDSTPAQYRPGWLAICRAALRLVREHDPAFWALHTGRVAALQADAPPVTFAPGNLCQGKQATQSSLSPYSIGRTLEEDAAGAINGRIDGQIKFHTDMEDSPWWQVDLGAMFGVSQVKIYNRMDVPGVMARAAHLAIEVGFRGDDWVEIYRRKNPEPFGGIDGNPLVFAPTIPVPARFVRVRLLRRDYLHLDQVEVFGEKLSASIAKNLDRFFGQQPKFVSNDVDNRELFSNFISLGLNCEFGIVQKLSGLTKLGLLDWCATPIKSVLEMLRSNFDGVGNPEQTKIAVKGDDYDVFDTRYNFAGHSFVNPNDISADVFYQQITQRLKFLRRKMIEELEIGEAIFIYKMNGNPVDPRLIRDVAIEIKRYGNGALLSVCDAAVTGCPSGHVRWLGGNLFEGHLDHMADLAEAGSVSLPHWRELCLNALELILAVRADGEFLNRNVTPNTGVAGYWHRDQLNIASGKFAAQSSVSPWSHGSTTVDDALGCLIGVPNGRANCHTSYDADPWWMVDLGQNFDISSIVIFNRVDEQEIMKRSSHLAVEVATDTDAFREIYRRDVDEPFGGIDSQPLIIASDAPIRARFVLIRLLTQNFLHLDKVEVYGTPSHPV